MAEEEKLPRGESVSLHDGDEFYEPPRAGEAHDRVTDQSVK